jgi:hypothetical protein
VIYQIICALRLRLVFKDINGAIPLRLCVFSSSELDMNSCSRVCGE